MNTIAATISERAGLIGSVIPLFLRTTTTIPIYDTLYAQYYIAVKDAYFNATRVNATHYFANVLVPSPVSSTHDVSLHYRSYLCASIVRITVAGPVLTAWAPLSISGVTNFVTKYTAGISFSYTGVFTVSSFPSTVGLECVVFTPTGQQVITSVSNVGSVALSATTSLNFASNGTILVPIYFRLNTESAETSKKYLILSSNFSVAFISSPVSMIASLVTAPFNTSYAHTFITPNITSQLFSVIATSSIHAYSATLLCNFAYGAVPSCTFSSVVAPATPVTLQLTLKSNAYSNENSIVMNTITYWRETSLQAISPFIADINSFVTQPRVFEIRTATALNTQFNYACMSM